jgi:NTE family protein
MPLPKPFGLALSGGGFRAAAFHLGVLKRLRELKLLGEVDVLSTVSGGSIIGAFWLYCQAYRGDTLASDEKWDEFERSLVELMLKGLFGQLLWRVLVRPLLPIAIGCCILYLGLLGLLPSIPLPGGATGLAVGLLLLLVGLAVAIWHYRATPELEALYDTHLFNGGRLKDLAYPNLHRQSHLPHLLVNATGLNAGNLLLLFSKLKEEMVETENYEDRIDYLIQPIQTRKGTIAEAVTASSAIPHVFAPLPIFAEIPASYPLNVANPEMMTGNLKVFDGGIFDNQGTQALLSREFLCRGIIGSDGSAALSFERSPSAWVLPVSRGRLMRAQNIIYERSRDFGYLAVSSRHTVFDILQKARQAGISQELLNKWRSELEPVVEGYAYVELDTVKDFPWQSGRARLPKHLCPFVARIRTHLDAFTPLELSALMFHGYTQIDHCLREYHNDWILKDAPLKFQSSVAHLNNINWIELSKKEIRAYAKELQFSHLGPVQRRFRQFIERIRCQWQKKERQASPSRFHP